MSNRDMDEDENYLLQSYKHSKIAALNLALATVDQVSRSQERNEKFALLDNIKTLHICTAFNREEFKGSVYFPSKQIYLKT